MIRFTFIAFSLATAQAAPVPKAAQTTSIAGTTWQGDGVVGETKYVFHDGGGLSYTHSNTTYTSGSWKQDGNRIYMEFNNKYCEFEGTINGREISGRAWNVNNFKKEFKFWRVD